MNRISIQIPERVLFATELSIRVTDLNYGGHLGNDRILSICHEARMQFLQSLGATELDAFGVGMIMADAAIQFKAEGFFGDVLRVELGAGEIGSRSWNFYYQLMLKESNTPLALVKTGMAAFNYKTKKVVSLPLDLMTALGRSV
jgi:acyl-CoA thioesterase FadM